MLEKDCPDFGYSCIYDAEGNKLQTQAIIMKWLREVHNIQIQIAPITSRHKDWTFGIYKDFNPIASRLQCFDTYEQTVEEVIKYCLKNLI